MRIAALVKQIPAFEEMELGPDGRLRREGLDLEMNPYCRRAVSQAVELAAAVGDGTVTVLTLGPPSADDTLREAIAWGAQNNVFTDGVLITDPAFAGSDTLATARALAAALNREGPFDLVLLGRNSVDADTGQVGPELAELLDLPFATGVRYLSMKGTTLHLRCEHDDGWVQAEISTPAVISAAERLIEPCKVPPDERTLVPGERIRVLTAADLGDGPWGAAGSPTTVGPVRVHEVRREQVVLDGALPEQVQRAVELIGERRALDAETDGRPERDAVAPARGAEGRTIAVLAEPDRAHVTRELLGCAARLAADIDGHVVAVNADMLDAHVLASWGADVELGLGPELVEEDVAAGLATWAADTAPWAILAPSTAWGREVSSRAAAALGAGLTGDAVALEVDDDRLVAWKPAFGGQLVASITASSATQMATVRAGVLPTLAPRDAVADSHTFTVASRGRVRVLARTRDDDLDTLAEAHVVIGVGQAIEPSEYDQLEPLRAALGAELAATRKVTDKGWMPRARQLGITGRTIAPRLYVAIALGGKFNHMVGVRASGTVLAINTDRDALVFGAADVGIVGDWHEAVPLLAAAIADRPQSVFSAR
jgi:electron transfer flavoprotein alpha subunit